MSTLFSSSPLILGAIEDIDIKLIVVPEHHFRQKQMVIEELAASIREKGLLQPLVVRPKLDHFEIIAGIRRYYACKTNGWKKIICHIVELDDKESFEVALIENIQRKNLDPIEEANAFKEYILSFGWGGISNLASKIGKSISYIDKRIRMLELPKDIVEKISSRVISPSLGEELLFIKNDNYTQRKIVEIASNSRLSTKKARRLIRSMDRIYAYGYDDQEMSSDLGSHRFIDMDYRINRSFDKAILYLRIASNKLARVIEDNQDNWIMYEILMQHKKIVNQQVDLLIKEKKRIA